ncbi:TPA: hypothetical protein ACNBQL_003625, partial [Escherichia coli]
MDFLAYRYYRATGYHFHLARIARNHVIRGLYLLDIALQASPFLASILERDQYLWGSDQFWAEFVQPGRT